MTQPHDFSVKDELSDVTLLVDEQKLHVNKAFLSTMSPVFFNMFMKDFAESKQAEVEVKGPPGMEMTHDQFLELMKVIHPPLEDIKACTVDYLLELANYFDMGLVFNRVDSFLGEIDPDSRLVPLFKKSLLIDKYYDKLPKTNKLVFGEFRKPLVARDLMEKPDYAKLSGEIKLELLQDLVNTNKFFDEKKATVYEEVRCKNCNSYNIVQKHRMSPNYYCFCVQCKSRINY